MLASFLDPGNAVLHVGTICPYPQKRLALDGRLLLVRPFSRPPMPLTEKHDEIHGFPARFGRKRRQFFHNGLTRFHSFVPRCSNKCHSSIPPCGETFLPHIAFNRNLVFHTAINSFTFTYSYTYSIRLSIWVSRRKIRRSTLLQPCLTSPARFDTFLITEHRQLQRACVHAA